MQNHIPGMQFILPAKYKRVLYSLMGRRKCEEHQFSNVKEDQASMLSSRHYES